MKLLDAKQINKDVITKVSEFYQGKQNKVVILSASDDEASEVYIDKKQKAFEEVGVECLVYDLDEYTTTEDMITEIEELNNDDTVTGIMVQYPLYDGIDVTAVMSAIKPTKDLDGLHPFNQGLANYKAGILKPATAYGVELLIDEANYDVSGKLVVIIGRGFLVADVLAKELENRNATVVKIHTRTDNWDKTNLLTRADVIISCTGQDLSGELHPYNCMCADLLIGVGFRYENGKQVQDFDLGVWEDEEDVIVTDRINATGLATISALLLNSTICYNLNKGEN